MPSEQLSWLVAGILVIAFLYSSVGHAGASGYIAVMTLGGLAPETIKPIALVLNILVAALGTYQFSRAGHFRWHAFWPFALLSIPLAFVGGYVNLPAAWFKKIVGAVLLVSAARFFYDPREAAATRLPKLPVAIGVGGALGLLAGLTGTGGGIFLTPLMIVMRWAPTKTASATSVVFILVNSASGLFGNLSATKSLPPLSAALAVAAIAGGAAGSYLGSRRFSPVIIKRLLAVVLVIAGLKLVNDPTGRPPATNGGKPAAVRIERGKAAAQRAAGAADGDVGFLAAPAA
ncbi:MAG: hypothetical protein DCC67_06440, partial [Planctomycetota bacterium]